jgi:protein involved in polysaccharide export with SLBB domain
MQSDSRARLTRRAYLQNAAVLLLGATTGCSGTTDNTRLNLPAPTEKSTVGPGDVFTLEIVGEKDLPREYQVASDGSVDLPFVHTVQVAGLEPQEIARLTRKLLMDSKVLTDPSVVVQVKEYNSRRVTILGQVSKPGTFPYTPGLTLIQAVSQAGGLTALANLNRVNLTRRSGRGARTVELSIGSIMEGRSPDIPLQSGDRIFVHERLF